MSSKLETKSMQKEFAYILDLFQKKGLDFIMFKHEHVLDGENSNLDLLFLKDTDYYKAGKVLEKEGFEIFLSEKVEKYKTLYHAIIGNKVISIHIHREVAWNNIRILKKDLMRKEKRILSAEDSLLVHIAHVIFENYRCTSYVRKLINEYLKNSKDWKYIDKQLTLNGWKKEFYIFLDYIKGKKGLPHNFYRNALIKKIIRKRLLENIYNASLKIISFLKIRFFKTRKGCVISFIGVNGCGKSSLQKELLEHYKKITLQLGISQKGYYFGFRPYLWITKKISERLSKKNKQIFDDVNIKKVGKPPRFDLFLEMMFLYDFIDYYFRYRGTILNDLKKSVLVITDRSFLDFYGQYEYAPNSILLKPLMWLFPKPDKLFFIDVDISTLTRRRPKHPKEYLETQLSRFREMKKILKLTVIDGTQDINKELDILKREINDCILKKLRV